ncbi:MAG: hypothetical protein ACHQU0_01480 [Candidatus Paceibacteria bacterium]
MQTRTWRAALLLLVMTVPFVGHADVPDPFIYDAGFHGMPSIPNTFYDNFQTAARVGDKPILEAYVHSIYIDPPSISADLSLFGLSSSTTATGMWWSGYSGYDPAYYYNFGRVTVDSSLSEGIHTIPITATNMLGVTSTGSASLLVDNVPPTVSLSSITFSTSTTSPKHGDYMYLSGKIDGTGSVGKASQMSLYLTDAAGNPTISTIAGGSTVGYGTEAINAALATSTDGSFSNVPVRLVEFGDTGWIGRADNFTIELQAYDEAGNFASTTLTVPVPKPVPADPCIALGTCVSNVLFLPGIEGSRLYEGTGCGKTAEEKLWDPLDSYLIKVPFGAGDAKVHELALEPTGESHCTDIYAKEGDVIDSVSDNNLYKSFIDEMNGLKSDGSINAWEPVAYDWRLSLPDLLTKGTERDGKIYYEEATSTPYIEQTLRALAASSKTGKATIVAHSNGGLVAKALLNELGDAEAAKLVDKVIMVAVPQTGAPADIGSMLVGYGAGIYKDFYVSKLKGTVTIVSNQAARAFSQNSPMAYHLLPSENYLASIIQEPTHPVVHFSGDGYAKEIASYGNSIVDISTLDKFLVAASSERTKPSYSDLLDAEILSPDLIGYANGQHTTLDGWVPPAGIKVDQIAGWGVDTVAGIDFYTLPGQAVSLVAAAPIRTYKPIWIEDGDGTVPTPSALIIATSTNVSRYWLNLVSSQNKHGDILENTDLRTFLDGLLTKKSITLPPTISTETPVTSSSKKLIFTLHSPLTLQLTDTSGASTGLAPDGTVTEDIPGSTYGEFGEVKYVIVPEGSQYQLSLHGQATGTFSLDMQEYSGGTVTTSSTFANVPTTENTLASLTVSDGSDVSALSVDENGDGKDVITLPLKTGETVNYVPPEPEAHVPAAPAPSHSEPAYIPGSISIPFIAPVTITATTSGTATVVATTTTEVPVAVSSAQTKGKQLAFVPKTSGVMKQNTTATSKTVNNEVPQLAAVYEASKQSSMRSIGAAVYNGLHGLWAALIKFF